VELRQQFTIPHRIRAAAIQLSKVSRSSIAMVRKQSLCTLTFSSPKRGGKVRVLGIDADPIFTRQTSVQSVRQRLCVAMAAHIAFSVSPCCKAAMENEEKSLRCTGCGWVMPVVNGTPILIFDERSVFKVSDFVSGSDDETQIGYHDVSSLPHFHQRLRRRIANALSNREAPVKWFSKEDAVRAVCERRSNPRILVIGAGILRFDTCSADFTYTDASRVDGIDYVCDAHDLPFVDETFDAVIAVALLEHVADPFRCVAEIARVLKPDGFVHAESPFLQPVHMGRYDFTRFTPLGHRRLFRQFEAIQCGVALGPGSVLAWAIRYWLLSLTDNITARKWIRAFGLLVTMPVRYSDVIFKNKVGAGDCAGGNIFFGQKTASVISDRDLLQHYVGRDQVYS
jgi:SAM-dependent methyltransferase